MPEKRIIAGESGGKREKMSKCYEEDQKATSTVWYDVTVCCGHHGDRRKVQEGASSAQPVVTTFYSILGRFYVLFYTVLAPDIT